MAAPTPAGPPDRRHDRHPPSSGARPRDDRGTFLSVVIPTYNRAEDLDRQLEWLHRELDALEVTWDVHVHDNCSTDETPKVTQKWQELFGSDVFHVTRNATNIGGIPNLDQAIAGASGAWVWSLGDDDLVYDGAAAHVVDVLGTNPDLTLLYLNYQGVDSASGEDTCDHYFDPAVSGRLEDGPAAVEHHASAELGSVIFLTATIYRTSLVHEAQRRWRHDVHNWALVAYWTGWVSARGPIYITPENWIDCVVGQSHWQSERGAWTRAIYEEIPKVFRALEKEGYPPDFCRHEGLKELRRTRGGLRDHARALRYCPQCVLTLGALLAGGGWFFS